MMMFKIAFRSIFRNTRRSVTTMSTIAIGTAAVLIFGAFITFITYGVQTGAVQRTGHFQVFRKGYFEFGTGNPAVWGIDNYERVVSLIQDDPTLKPLTAVVTPIQILSGIAGDFEHDTSKTYLGVGFVPSNRDRMKHWNEYGTGAQGLVRSGLKDSDPTHGIVGFGFARILGLCDRLHLDCPKAPPAPVDAAIEKEKAAELASVQTENVSDLIGADDRKPAAVRTNEARIDLLAGTAGGAPNVVSLLVDRVENQPVKELDDNYIGLNLALAQQLIYGRGEHKATGIVVQLNRTEDMKVARERLAALFKQRKLDLEVRDFTELNPQYNQVINLFGSIFSFISVIIGIVVLFTVSNAMGMSVVERTDEIGTTRAMGVRRRGIRRQFLLEGSLLGVIGAVVGLVLSIVTVYAVNGAGLTWTPPGNASAVPLRLYMDGPSALIVGTLIALVVVATIAALVPANRAARLPVVDALRHV